MYGLGLKPISILTQWYHLALPFSRSFSSSIGQHPIQCMAIHLYATYRTTAKHGASACFETCPKQRHELKPKYPHQQTRPKMSPIHHAEPKTQSRRHEGPRTQGRSSMRGGRSYHRRRLRQRYPTIRRSRNTKSRCRRRESLQTTYQFYICDAMKNETTSACWLHGISKINGKIENSCTSGSRTQWSVAELNIPQSITNRWTIYWALHEGCLCSWGLSQVDMKNSSVKDFRTKLGVTLFTTDYFVCLSIHQLHLTCEVTSSSWPRGQGDSFIAARISKNKSQE